MPVRSDFLWADDVTEEEYIEGMQGLINSGTCWHMEGSVGRAASDLIQQGLCVLGERGFRDAYYNYVPSRYEVKPGAPGSQAYADKMQAARA